MVGILLLASLWAIGVGGLYVFQRSLVFQPDSSPPESAWSASAKNVTLHPSDGLDLHAWVFEPTALDLDAAILIAPGNAGNRGTRAGVAARLADLGYTVLLLDYRGYGGNPGDPSEEGLALDALAAASWLRSAGFPPGRTLYVGQSLGTGVVVRLAATNPPGAMLLQSPYTSMVAVAQGKFPLVPFDLLLKDRFDTMRYLHELTMPITVLAGGRDTLVPASQSAAVAEATPNLFRYVETPDADHNDIYWSGPGLPAQVDELARAALHI